MRGVDAGKGEDDAIDRGVCVCVCVREGGDDDDVYLTRR